MEVSYVNSSIYSLHLISLFLTIILQEIKYCEWLPVTSNYTLFYIFHLTNIRFKTHYHARIIQRVISRFQTEVSPDFCSTSLAIVNVQRVEQVKGRRSLSSLRNPLFPVAAMCANVCVLTP